MDQDQLDRFVAEIGADELVLLAAYLSGRATASERQEIESRAIRDERFATLLSELRSAWEQSDRVLRLDVSADEISAKWNELVAAEPSLRVEGEPGWVAASTRSPASTRTFVQPRRGRFGGTAGYAIAASVLLVVGVASWRMGLLDGGDPPSVAAAEFLPVESAPGVWRHLTLRDGSKVTLGPGSRLAIPRDYGSGRRELHLTGRAMFAVTEDSVQPFQVVTANAVSRVMGTEFGVRAEPGTSATEVVVRSGTVGIGSTSTPPGELRLLGAGDRGVVDRSGRIMLEANADTAVLLGWASGRLTFAGVALREAVPELERWFGVRILLSDEAIGQRRLTGTFERESLEFVLQSIGDVTGSRWERSAGEVTLSPR